MRFEVILNPKAGKKKVHALLAVIKREFGDIKISYTKKRHDATIIAYRSNANILLVAGGDGTINETINGIMKKRRRPIIGILPFGTANILANQLGITSISKGLIAIKKGRFKGVDVGTINNCAFINAAGVGVDADMFRTVPKSLKQYVGKAAYTLAAIPAILRYRPKLITVDARGIHTQGYYVMICNVGRYGPFLNVAPNSKIDDGKLDVLVFRNKSIVDTLRYSVGVMLRSKTILSDVVSFQTKSLRISSKSRVPLHTDAEYIGTTPAKVRIRPKAIKVFCDKKPNT